MICGANRVFQDTWVERAQRFLVLTLPLKLRSSCSKICPSFCCTKSQEECYGKTGPCRYGVAIFFFIIYTIFASIYFTRVYPLIPHLYKNPDFHEILSALLLPVPWFLFFYFQIADPGEITKENVDKYLKIFPYDNVIYTPHECQTLKIPVVPRSRFCNYCQKRIAKYDHYCPWVLAPIGMKTHRFFLLFILSIANVSLYYSIGAFKVLFKVINIIMNNMKKEHRDPNTSFDNLMSFLLILVTKEALILLDSIILIAIGIIMYAFFIQQVVNVSRNITQIEPEKYFNAEHDLGHPVQNFYTKGFWGNWKEELFPPKIE